MSAAFAARAVLQELRTSGTTSGRAQQMLSYEQFSDVVDLEHYTELDDRFGPARGEESK